MSSAFTYVNVALSLYVAVVASLSSDQPRNVQPVLSNAFAVNVTSVLNTTFDIFVISPDVALFPLNVML